MWKYLKSREFRLTALFILLGMILLFVLFFFVFLPLYTHHGASVEVPNVTEMSLDEAIEELEERDLRYEVVDSLYNSEMKPLAVISQDPVQKSTVKPGRRIYLTVNKTVPPKVKVPHIVGVSPYQAKLRLEGANLKEGRKEFVPHQYANLVISITYKGKKIKEGDMLPKFAKVDLIIGMGTGSDRYAIPDLVGMPIEQAIATLNRMGLTFAPPRFQPEVGGDPGLVTQQSPRFMLGDSVRSGTEFVLFVSGQEPEEAREGFDTSSDTANAGNR